MLLLASAAVNAQVSDFAHINFRRADSVARKYANADLKNPYALAQSLTRGLDTDVEKFRSIYKWVCDNVTYDYSMHVRNQKKRSQLTGDARKQWDEQIAAEMFQTLVKRKRTVCTGYAYLLRELSALAGLTCESIDGYGRTGTQEQRDFPNHTWNAISLNGKWYLCDPTWSAGAYDHEKNEFVPEYNDGYFLAHPLVFAMSHHPLDSKWLLINPQSKDEFFNQPFIYGAAFRYGIYNIQPLRKTFKVKKGEKVTIRFRMDKEPRLMMLMSGASSRLDLVSKRWYLDDQGNYCFDYVHRAAKEQKLHLLIDNYFAMSWVVSTAD